MKRFINKNSVSVTSRVWKSPTGTRIPWRGDTTPFTTFVAQVQAYCRQNNLPEPSADELENLMCEQSPSRDCTSDPNYHVPEQVRVTQDQRSGGCSACGKR